MGGTVPTADEADPARAATPPTAPCPRTTVRKEPHPPHLWRWHPDPALFGVWINLSDTDPPIQARLCHGEAAHP